MASFLCHHSPAVVSPAVVYRIFTAIFRRMYLHLVVVYLPLVVFLQSVIGCKKKPTKKVLSKRPITSKSSQSKEISKEVPPKEPSKEAPKEEKVEKKVEVEEKKEEKPDKATKSVEKPQKTEGNDEKKAEAAANKTKEEKPAVEVKKDEKKPEKTAQEATGNKPSKEPPPASNAKKDAADGDGGYENCEDMDMEKLAKIADEAKV